MYIVMYIVILGIFFFLMFPLSPMGNLCSYTYACILVVGAGRDFMQTLICPRPITTIKSIASAVKESNSSIKIRQ